MKLFARMLVCTALILPAMAIAGSLKGPPPETKELIRLSSEVTCLEVLNKDPDTSGWVVLASGYIHNRDAIRAMDEDERQQYADGMLALCQMFPEEAFVDLVYHLQ